MSSEQIAIQVSGLSKHYQIYQKPEDRLKQYVLPRLQRLTGRKQQQYYRDFKALDDINFEVKRGEAVGIVGRNGAGKSTLLQIICGTLTQTSGNVVVNGTVAALLELGSGFKSEFTGRENVYMNASLLGLSSDEIDQKFNEIAEFADIGDYIEQPTKTYSSGMRMRLAFAVNTCVEPDILIVDEALGVGDAPFQSKCFKRLHKLIDNGTTVLFVSHAISTVRSICNRALWLKQGRAEMWGDAMEVSKQYERFCWQEQGVVLDADIFEQEVTESHDLIEPTFFDTQESGRAMAEYPSELFKPSSAFAKNREQTRMGTGDVEITNIIVLNHQNQISMRFGYNEKIKVVYLLTLKKNIDSDFILALRIRDLKGTFVYSVNDLHKIHRIKGMSGEQLVATIETEVPLHHQDYIISTAIFGFRSGNAFTNGKYDFTGAVIWESIDDAAYITVEQYKIMPLAGPVHMSCKFNLERVRQP